MYKNISIRLALAVAVEDLQKMSGISGIKWSNTPKEIFYFYIKLWLLLVIPPTLLPHLP